MEIFHEKLNVQINDLQWALIYSYSSRYNLKNDFFLQATKKIELSYGDKKHPKKDDEMDIEYNGTIYDLKVTKIIGNDIWVKVSQS